MARTVVEISGHIIDSLILPKILDHIVNLGAEFDILEIQVGHRRADRSYARIQIDAPTLAMLDIVLEKIKEHGAGAISMLAVPASKILSCRAPMRLLMCPPDYYGIEYEINPWMKCARQTDLQRAEAQWHGLYEVLTARLGIEVAIIEPQAHLPDMVFTANGGLVYQQQFIVSNFRHPVRRPESQAHEAWFRERGYHIHRLPEEFCFEGEGDLLRCGDLWFAGYHIRSDMRAHQIVAGLIGQEILSLELVSDWFYHLDTCFCPLNERRALYFPEAFDHYALRVLENHFAELIAVPAGDALRFACNAIVHGNSVVLNDGCRATREQLIALGYRVFETPLDEFIKAGGSAKCLVLTLG